MSESLQNKILAACLTIIVLLALLLAYLSLTLPAPVTLPAGSCLTEECV